MLLLLVLGALLALPLAALARDGTVHRRKVTGIVLIVFGLVLGGGLGFVLGGFADNAGRLIGVLISSLIFIGGIPISCGMFLLLRPPAPVGVSGARLRKARTEAQLSLDDLANAVGCSAKRVGAFERGERCPSGIQLRRIASSTEKPVDWFSPVDARATTLAR